MKIISYLSCLLLITSTSALAMQVQPDKQGLLASCQALAQQPVLASAHKSVNACHYYIQGILANTYFNESINVASLNEANTQELSFVQRAYNTRIGNRLNTSKPLYSNYFCLPENESLAQVIQVLSKPLQSDIKTTKDLNATIFYTLKAQYPCS